MFTGKKILIIGGTGTIGQAMTARLLTLNPKVIRIFSRDEYKQFMMKEQLAKYNSIRFLLGDVRDKERVSRAMNDIDIVFNLAAMKHVPACEYDPFEAVKTNVIGTQNVIDCALEHKVQRVIYASSDKAVSPTNTMGATKLLAERLIASADYSKGKEKTVFAAVRFGNVMETRGSVLPLWREQIKKERAITITEPAMTRFMMSIDQAVSLLLQASEQTTGGEIFVLKMPVIRLQDLAEAVIDEMSVELQIASESIQIHKVGLRPGEKMYEELMTEDESLYAQELEEMFCIRNFNKVNANHGKSATSYRSDQLPTLSQADIKQLLHKFHDQNIARVEMSK